MHKNVFFKKILVASPLVLMSLFAYSTAKAVTPMGCQAKGALYVLKNGVQTLVATIPGAGTTATASNQGHAGFKTNPTGEFNLTIPNRVLTAGEQYYFRMEVHNSQYLAYGISGLYGNTFSTLPTNVTGQVMCAGAAPSQNAGVKLGPIPPLSRFVHVTKASGNAPVTECFKDTVTNKVWEGKEPPGTSRGKTATFTNYDDTTKLQYPTGSTPAYRQATVAEVGKFTQSTTGDNSVGYKNWVNSNNLCGSNQWRIPSADELSTLYTALGGAGSANFSQWLPNTDIYYLTATAVSAQNLAKTVNFANGAVSTGSGRNNLYKIRLVHD